MSESGSSQRKDSEGLKGWSDDAASLRRAGESVIREGKVICEAC